MATAELPSRTLPSRSARISLSYQEPDTESDVELEQAAPIRRRTINSSNRIRQPPPRTRVTSSTSTSTSRRPTRTREKRVTSYRELSDSDEAITSDEDVDATGADTYSPSITPATSTPSIKYDPPKRSRKSGVRQLTSNAFDGHKRRKIGHPRKLHKPIPYVTSDFIISNHNSSLPWQTLPYAILVKILKYAAYPLYTSTDVRTPGIQWLIDTSRLCKSLHDAATTVLLCCPPLLPNEHAKGLVELLSSDPTTLTINYPQRIKALHIEVRDLLLRKSGVQLDQLLQRTPLLCELRIYHRADKYVGKALWAEPGFTREKWSYGSLFDILDASNIRLEVFEWNGRFQDMITSMPEAHKLVCMQTLRDLTIVNLMFDEKREGERVLARDSVLQALSLLPALKSLNFDHCNILDDIAMSQLPPALSSLSINSCISLTSDGIKSHLDKSGTSLHHLDLVGNQVMSLGFISDLQKACPILETLHIDLNYDDCTSYNDREPLYDELLPNGPPTWPTNLSSIVIGPLRSLSVSDAESFFTSLIAAAESFKYLRILSLKTILTEASWRDRARLRSEWTACFEKVFLRRDKPQSKTSNQNGRKSVRLQELEDSSSYDSIDEKDNMASGKVTPRQNACHTVVFELSDQRPASNQFTEQDFIDEELAGDGTYNG